MTYAIHQRGGFLGGKKFAIGQRSRTMFAFLEECRTIKPSRSMLRIMRVRLYKRKANSATIRPQTLKCTFSRRRANNPSLVTVLIRCGLPLPTYILADEKHS